MFSKDLMKQTIKDNWKLWLGITVAVSILTIIVFATLDSGPPEMWHPGANGGGRPADTMLNQLFGMFAILLPLIYITMTGHKLIAAQVDNGSLAPLMSKPITRNQVTLTKMAFFVGSIIAMFTVMMIVGFVMIAVTDPIMRTGEILGYGTFALLILGIVCMHLAIAEISFLASCIFNTSSRSLLVGAGIPVMFFIFNILATYFLDVFRFFTIMSLFDVEGIIAHSTNMAWQFPILLMVAIGCFTAGVLYFKRKDLPL